MAGSDWLLLAAWGWDLAWGTTMKIHMAMLAALQLCSRWQRPCACLRATVSIENSLSDFAITVWRDFLVAGKKKAGSSRCRHPAEKAYEYG